MTDARTRGLSLLTIATWAHLVRAVTYPLLVFILIGHSHVDGTGVVRLLSIAGIGIGVLAVVAWIKLAQGTPPSRAGLAYFVVVLIGLQVLLNIAAVIPNAAFAITTTVSGLWNILSLAEMAVGWYALLCAGDDSTPRSMRGLTAGVWIVVVVCATTDILQHVHDLTLRSMLYNLMSLGSIAYSILMLVGIHRVRTTDGGATIETPVSNAGDADRDVLVGSLMLGGGIVVSIISFFAAHQMGGRYVFFTGAIAFGIVRLKRGLERR